MVGSSWHLLGHGGPILTSRLVPRGWQGPALQTRSSRDTCLRSAELTLFLTSGHKAFIKFEEFFAFIQHFFFPFWFPFPFSSVTVIICVLIGLLDFMSWFIDVVPIFSHISLTLESWTTVKTRFCNPLPHWCLFIGIHITFYNTLIKMSVLSSLLASFVFHN